MFLVQITVAIKNPDVKKIARSVPPFLLRQLIPAGVEAIVRLCRLAEVLEIEK